VTGNDFDDIPTVIDAVRRGQLVLIADHEDRENEGDLILAAAHANASTVAFMISLGRGLLCLPLTASRAAELDFPPMVATNADPMRTAFTVSVDAIAARGVGTGISASDRAITSRTAIDGTAADFTRPGHLFPLVAKDGGVLARPGHTEAGVDLARLAGFDPIALIIEVIGEDGEMLRGTDLLAFARRHRLPVATIDALVQWRTATGM
jgi:3,4-dihydroxy 2-butanone 4-phosphate synthase/GTP cyclohydrolase II